MWAAPVLARNPDAVVAAFHMLRLQKDPNFPQFRGLELGLQKQRRGLKKNTDSISKGYHDFITAQ